MGKQGPCYHCGIATTPLWRNGPPDKPVLCNACGSRWRTKGTLVNYMPMHAGGFGPGGGDRSKWNPIRTAPAPAPEARTIVSRKRKEPSDGNSESGISKTSTYNSTSADEDANEDASTRSSLGSEVSTFDDTLIGSALAPVRGAPWDTPVPSRKRTNMFRSRAPSDKIGRNLVSIEEQEVSSVTCPESGDGVLVETRSPLIAVEIGLGSVFIRQPPQQQQQQHQYKQQQHQHQYQQQQHQYQQHQHQYQQHQQQHQHQYQQQQQFSQQQEHESEASSLLIDSNARGGGGGGGGNDHGEVRSGSEPRFAEPYSSVPSRGKEKLYYHRPETQYNPNRALLENFPYNKRTVLQSRQSPLNFLELKDIINADTFTELLTDQEQLQLLKHLSSVDISHCPKSLSSMFESSQFESSLWSFQRLLSEGLLEEAGPNPRILQHYQQLLSVTDLTASGWTDNLCHLQNQARACKRRAEPPCIKEHKLLKVPCAANYVEGPTLLERLPDSRIQGNYYKTQHLTQTNSKHNQEPSSALQAGTSSLASDSATLIAAAAAATATVAAAAKRPVRNVMAEGQDSGGEQDLLVNMPSSMSFRHDAELLLLQKPSPAEQYQVKDKAAVHGSESPAAGDLIVTNTWHSTDWDGFLWTARGGGGSRRRVLPNGTVLNP